MVELGIMFDKRAIRLGFNVGIGFLLALMMPVLVLLLAHLSIVGWLASRH